MQNIEAPELVIKANIVRWQESTYESIKALERDYFSEHSNNNNNLEYKDKGYTAFRVRRRETATGISIAIEWYKWVFVRGKEKQPRSKFIKKGSSNKALLNNIKKTARPWEYELASIYVEKLRPYVDTLKVLGKMSRYNYAAMKVNPIQNYIYLDTANHNIDINDRK